MLELAKPLTASLDQCTRKKSRSAMTRDFSSSSGLLCSTQSPHIAAWCGCTLWFSAHPPLRGTFAPSELGLHLSGPPLGGGHPCRHL